MTQIPDSIQERVERLANARAGLDEAEIALADRAEQQYGVLARQAYTAYGATTGNKNYQGLPMPAWDALTPRIRLAWCMAVRAVLVTSLDAGFGETSHA